MTTIITADQVFTKLRECYDPEVPCNIVDLGLIYDVKVTEARVDVKMTLTAQACPLAHQITARVQQKLLELPGVTDAQVELVFDPPWTPSRISEDGKRQLRLR